MFKLQFKVSVVINGAIYLSVCLEPMLYEGPSARIILASTDPRTCHKRVILKHKVVCFSNEANEM
jgi:hypothetical protein